MYTYVYVSVHVLATVARNLDFWLFHTKTSTGKYGKLM